MCSSSLFAEQTFEISKRRNIFEPKSGSLLGTFKLFLPIQLLNNHRLILMLTYRFPLSCLFIFIFSSSLIAQSFENEADSLFQQLRQAKSDTERADIHYYLSRYYKTTEPQKMLIHTDSALFYLKNTPSPLRESSIYVFRGIYYRLTGAFDQSLTAYLHSLDIAKEISDTLQMTYCLMNIGNLYQENIKDYEEAGKYYKQALSFKKMIQDQEGIVPVYINLAALYHEGLKKYSSARDYIDSALAVTKDLDNEMTRKTFRLSALINRAEIFKSEDNESESLKTMEEAFQIAVEIKFLRALAHIELFYAKLFENLNNFPRALAHLKLSESYANAAGLKAKLKEIAEKKALLYAKMNEFEKAFEAQTQVSKLSDSIHKKLNKMLQIHKDYELSINKKVIEKNKTQFAIKSKKNKVILYLLLGLGVCLLVIIGSIYLRKEQLAKNKRKTEQLAASLLETNLQLSEELKAFAKKASKKSTVAKKYVNSSLSEKEKERYIASIFDYMDKESPYLNPSLTLQQLSNALNIKTHHLSEILNDHINRSFYDFINLYRIEAIKKKIIDPKESHKKILSLAYEFGFNSKSSFNNAFKKQTGLTPSEFKKAHSKNTSL